MKKFLVCGVLLVVMLAMSTFAAENQKADYKSLGEFDKIVMGDNNLPKFVSGKLSKASSLPASRIALDFISKNSDLFKKSGGKQEVLPSNLVVETDDLGFSHVRAFQTVDNIEIFGSDFWVHVNDKGEVYCMNGKYYDSVVPNTTSPTISEENAVQRALRDLGPGHIYRWKNENAVDKEDWIPEGELIIYPHKNDFRLAWRVVIGLDDVNEPANWDYYVDAVTGEILNKVNILPNGNVTGSGVTLYQGTKSLTTYQSGSTYYLKDTSREADYIEVYNANNGQSLPGYSFTDSDNYWNSTVQKAGVEALYNSQVFTDYFSNTFNRDSYDGNGAAIKVTVHFGSNYNNAYWNGSQIVFGDGDGYQFSPLMQLDVVVHELTHAITTSESNLYYNGESGALNESCSDFFGCIIEGNWEMGELCYTPNTANDAMRNVNDPSLNNLPTKYSERYTGSQDNGGVHYNCLIVLHGGGYLASEGGQGITGIGMAKTARIWYRAMTQYFGSYTDMHEGAQDLIQAAIDLYGEDSAERIAVQNGLAYVECADPYSGGGSGGGGNDDPYEPNNSYAEAYGPLESGSTYSSYLSSSSDDDYYMIEVGAGTIQLSLANFPGDYDMYLYNSGQTQVARAYTTNDPETINYTAAAGTYYIRIDGYNGANSTTDDYQLTAVFTAPGGGSGGGDDDDDDDTGDTYENNDSFANAYGPLTNGASYNSYLFTSSDVDYYKFEAGESGEIQVTLGEFPGDYDLYLYNSSQSQVAKAYTTNDPERITYNGSAGTYYVKVVGYNGAYSATDDYVLTASFPVSSGGGGGSEEPQWYTQSVSHDTPHNYPNNYNDYHDYYKAGAQKVALHFSQFETESNYDFVYIRDNAGTEIAKYHGSKEAFWAIVDGEYIKSQLVSDYSVTKYGYHIDGVAYYGTADNTIGVSSYQLVDGEILAAANDPVDNDNKLPKAFALNQNSPNPFNPETSIKIAVPKFEKVSLRVFNVNGQLVKTLINDKMEPGYYNIVWNGTNDNNDPVSSGVYYYKLKSDSFSETKKMMLMK